MSENTYFANRDSKEKISILLERAKTFYSRLETNDHIHKIRNMWRGYHGIFNEEGHEVTFSGEQGELVDLPVNHFRNLARHMYTMITSNRPVMECRAINSDYKSLAQTYIGNSILDYYMREKGLEDALYKAVENAIATTTGYIKMEWNATAGESYDIDPETGEFNYEGEIEFTTPSVLDVVFDGTKETWDHDWLIVRSSKNKYNLAAKYPELADKIKDLATKNQVENQSLTIFSNDDTDDVYIYEFFHRKTEAVPEGNYTLFLSNDIVLIDTILPYKEIPVYRVVPSEFLGTCYGYTPLFDLYPIQEALNSLYSAVLTNQNAFAVQNVFIKRGADITMSGVQGGMNLIEGNEPPVALNLTQTPNEVFKFIQDLIVAQETISGISSVTRGNPQASLESGAALAMVQSMSLQFISSLQQSYVKLIEGVGTGLINILKDYANTPKLVALVGKNNRSYLEQFTGDMISKINRVVVDVGNPLARCLEKDTPVLMFDGSIKMVQDIKIDEQIMGPDSLPRTVSNVNSGSEMMYKVTSKDKHRKISYGCNENHILTLKYCSEDYRYNAEKGDIIDISVKDYLKLTERQKSNLQGFKTGIEFEEKNLPINPYILGCWLGDGTSAATAITSMDEEIIGEWRTYAKELGMEFRLSTGRSSGKATTWFITSGQKNGASDRNPMMTALRELELINNKHIPQFYLTSSREQRLELLAGLIDTDGSNNIGTYCFIQKADRLTKDVIFLAESLGLRVTHKKRPTAKSKLCPNAEGEVNVLTIGGNLWEVPSRLPRKQCEEKEKARDWLNYGIEVTPVGEGTYYGFTLKEEPHFVLGDFTVTHNTTAGRVQMAEQLAQMNLLKTPEQYFQVIKTGQLETAFEAETGQLMLIKRENEQMMSGKSVRAIFLDRHRMHIEEHAGILSDPALREDPVLFQNVTEHIQEHINLLRTTDPELLDMRGEQPLGQGQPPGAVPMGNAQEVEGSNMSEMAGPPQGPQAPMQPQMPEVPTPPGEFANLPTNPAQMVP